MQAALSMKELKGYWDTECFYICLWVCVIWILRPWEKRKRERANVAHVIHTHHSPRRTPSALRKEPHAQLEMLCTAPAQQNSLPILEGIPATLK